MLDIIYEDNQIIVVVKPQNVPTQQDATNDLDMLSMVKQYIKEKYNKAGEAFVGLVHRLDRPTGGVMVFARNSKSASRLSAQIADGSFEKTYLAVVKGKPRQEKGRLVDYIKKDLRENKASIVPMAEKDAKKAELEYQVLETMDNLSLLKINLQTGRGHQIRVQMANIGNALYGDAKYGKTDKTQNLKTSNLALWATVLRFNHPTQDKVMLFKVFPPEEKAPWDKFNLDKSIKLI